MTATQKEIITLLHIADAHLRSAMVLAGTKKMVLVTDAIRESEWYLDEAIAHTEWCAKIALKRKSRKLLTRTGECVRMSA